MSRAKRELERMRRQQQERAAQDKKPQQSQSVPRRLTSEEKMACQIIQLRAELVASRKEVQRMNTQFRDMLAENVQLHNEKLEIQIASETRESELLMKKNKFPNGGFRWETTPDGATYLLTGDQKAPEVAAKPRVLKPITKPPVEPEPSDETDDELTDEELDQLGGDEPETQAEPGDEAELDAEQLDAEIAELEARRAKLKAKAPEPEPEPAAAK